MNSNKSSNYTKHILGLLLCLLIVTAVHSISYVQGSGDDVSQNQISNRDRDFYYHNNTDDQHWYGTSKWAVRFNFAEEYPEFTTSNFIINKVKVYFPVKPVLTSSISLEVRADTNNQPGTLLSTVSVDTTSNWYVFSLANPANVSSAWIVLNCSAAESGPYISSSVGGGTHSYYWNTNTPVHYYQNMYLSGNYSEFLFSVVGRFELSGLDLELSAFDLVPPPAIGETSQPQFTIFNNSNAIINSAKIALTLNNPSLSYLVQDTIFVTRPILPHSELIVPYDDPEYQNYSYSMPESSTQVKMVAVLHSEQDSVDSSVNNKLTKYYECFNEPMPIKLIENFISSSQAQNMLNAQAQYIVPGTSVINYFPLASDPYYATGTNQRFNWYGLTGLPMTILGGDGKITGFINTSYPAQFNSAYLDLIRDDTFLSQSSFSLNYPSPYSTIQIRLMLRNPYTELFNSTIDPSLTNQSRFYAALCKKTDLLGAERLLFNRWSAYGDTIVASLTPGGTYMKNFSVPVSDISIGDLHADYVLVYWIQKVSTKQILYCNTITLEELVSAHEYTEQPLIHTFTLKTNPIKRGSPIKLSTTSSDKRQFLQYELFNSKGQLLDSGNATSKNDNTYELPGTMKTSGIYLLRISQKDAQGKHLYKSQTKKILVY